MGARWFYLGRLNLTAGPRTEGSAVTSGSWGSATSWPGPTTPRPTASWNATIAPSKEQVKLVLHETPSVLEKAVAAFVDYYNHRRYQEGIGNVTPADVYYGRRDEIPERRKEVSKRTLQQRRDYHRASRERESRRSVH